MAVIRPKFGGALYPEIELEKLGTIVPGGTVLGRVINPFTFEERKKMISDSLTEKNIPPSRYQIYAIPDLHNYSKWLKKVIETLTPFELFYSNSSWIRQIIDDTGLKIAPKAIFNFSHYNGTNVRKCLMESQSIKDLVPSAVLKILSTIEALSRLN